jgi:hypothetical protein
MSDLRTGKFTGVSSKILLETLLSSAHLIFISDLVKESVSSSEQ